MLPGHQGRVRDLSFSPDGTQLLTGSFDQTIALWNLPEALALDDPVFACAWATDYLTIQAVSNPAAASPC